MATELEIKLIGALKAAWDELAETCEHCVYNKEVQCLEKQCPDYTEGVGVVDANDPSKVYPDFPWSCLDFEYGDCPHMDNTLVMDALIITPVTSDWMSVRLTMLKTKQYYIYNGNNRFRTGCFFTFIFGKET